MTGGSGQFAANATIAGCAGAAGSQSCGAGAAAKIEGENNQVAPMPPLPGMGMAGGASEDLPPGIPGYKGEERRKGDGVIADPATELDSGAKAGALVTPLPGPAAVEALITASPPSKIKQLVEAVLNAVGGDDPKIDEGKQGKHQPSHNNFIPGRSELIHSNPQYLIDSRAGKGSAVNDIPIGHPGSKERVDSGEEIGNYVDPVTGERKSTEIGIIHYGKGGVHIVSARPK